MVAVGGLAIIPVAVLAAWGASDANHGNTFQTISSWVTVTEAAAGTYPLSVPAGVTSFTFTMEGAGGGGGASGASGSAGGIVSGTITIPSSGSTTTFTVIVGGGGGGGVAPTGGSGGTSGAGCA
ncbi:MAG: hypothetical protein WB867_05230, partial [Candidatus Dormiibacterota bacterium]